MQRIKVSNQLGSHAISKSAAAAGHNPIIADCLRGVILIIGQFMDKASQDTIERFNSMPESLAGSFCGISLAVQYHDIRVLDNPLHSVIRAGNLILIHINENKAVILVSSIFIIMQILTYAGDGPDTGTAEADKYVFLTHRYSVGLSPSSRIEVICFTSSFLRGSAKHLFMYTICSFDNDLLYPYGIE